MNDTLTFIVGLAIFLGILWMLLQAGLLDKTPVDREENGAESEREVQHIVQASRPAPLDADDRLDELRTYTQRPHIKAGTAYGKEVL
jgi:hypothetical protein